MEPLRYLGHLLQHAVNAEPDHNPPLVGLDVDVRGAVARSTHEGRVHKLDDRRLVVAAGTE